MPMQTNSKSDPGARWLRCDLHVHTPFDKEKEFGENIQEAIKSFREQEAKHLAAIAENFLRACSEAADGVGMDLVALTDHNSIDGYRYLKPHFDTLALEAKQKGLRIPVILPGVEFSVGGERPIHFLVIFSSDTCAEDIEKLIAHVFGAKERFDSGVGTPLANGESVSTFLDRLYKYCRPDTGERDLQFVLLPAHADGSNGLAKVTGVRSQKVGGIMDQMKGQLRQQAITRRDWHGFQTAKPFKELPEAFKDLLLRWEASRRGDDWDILTEKKKRHYQNHQHWSLVECSDPHNYQNIGTRFSWLKMETVDVEGIRLALLDPESRLRRMNEGPPALSYSHITRITVEGTDFLENIEIPLSPCLTTLVGGRGSGKSTVIEYLRYAVDRDRMEDLPDALTSVRENVTSILSKKDNRDFGNSSGTLLPDHQISVEIIIAGKTYQILRSSSGIKIIREPNQQHPQSSNLDVHSLVSPRILSQRQIAKIARNPASQRHELDALVGSDHLRRIEENQIHLKHTLSEHQLIRKRLTESRAKIPEVTTELQKINDQISFVESEGRKEVFARFDELNQQNLWLEDALAEIKRLERTLSSAAEDLEEPRVETQKLSALKSEETWLYSVANRTRKTRNAVASALRKQSQSLLSLRERILSEKSESWQPDYDQAQLEYNALIDEIKNKGVELSGHERLLQRRAHLKREISSLKQASNELNQIEREIANLQLNLAEVHKERFNARTKQAQTLREIDADVRLEIIAFGDRDDFETRREQWFVSAGLQERDWKVLCDYIFDTQGNIPNQIRKLLKALRIDINASSHREKAISPSDSEVVSLVGEDRLTGNFFNALVKKERIRLDEMERFLPEDLVRAQVRTTDGSFKTIETGSIGEKSTAVLSLILSAGDQPIIIDQPEDDLDNRYVYSVVVDLVRRRKFDRQIIIATHNANIPVNGDAELIVALGAENRTGKVLGSGSIDQPEIKDLVTTIMEGSAEAFRLRRERYGY